ncbi:hypothetical protein H0H93_009228, partial [Arthromyces matolae]
AAPSLYICLAAQQCPLRGNFLNKQRGVGSTTRLSYKVSTEQDIRRVNFNVPELIRIACEAVGRKECLSMVKIAEGSFNKIFRMTFDNSKSIIARIPSSRMFGSGASNIISSEVAVMSLASKMDVNTPRVIAWSKGCDDPVGSPYILMEDVEGVTLDNEWLEPETRGDPVVKLLQQVASGMQKMSNSQFSQIGSPYFLQDLPDSSNLLPPPTDFETASGVRIGPIADFLWWRPYHDEPHLDRGPWNTVEDFVMAAVRIERRALERHREDPSSLAYTRSSIKDFDEIEDLLSQVEAFAPHIQRVIEEEESPLLPKRMMEICLMHPDIRTQNIMVPALTPDNSLRRLSNPVFIDWQGTCTLPLAFQWYLPPLVEYKPRLFHQDDGRPVFTINSLKDLEWPEGIDELHPQHQALFRSEHEIATRNVLWNRWFYSQIEFTSVMTLTMQDPLRMLTQGILRACADGPTPLRMTLQRIELAWDMEFGRRLGPCPFSVPEPDLMDNRAARFTAARSKLVKRLKCSVDGLIEPENYEASMEELKCARAEWDEESCG